MLNNNHGSIYYVSYINTGKIAIINGNNNNVISEIEIGFRPQNLTTDSLGNIYVANDKKVNVINGVEHRKCLDMPNNGNIILYAEEQKIYVSNTEELNIYNIDNGKMIASIDGFMACDKLEIDTIQKRLYALDILQKEIKVYNTDNFKLVHVIQNVGVAPSDFLLGEDRKLLYVANKGLKTRNYRSEINIMDVDSKKSYTLDLEKGSNIANLDQDEKNIYVANRGLNYLSVIDKQNKKEISKINPSLPYIKRVRSSNLIQGIIFIISYGDNGQSAIDLFDKETFSIKDTIYYEYDIPYDILGFKVREKDNENIVFMKLENE